MHGNISNEELWMIFEMFLLKLKLNKSRSDAFYQYIAICRKINTELWLRKQNRLKKINRWMNIHQIFELF